MRLKTLTEGAALAKKLGHAYMDDLCINGTDENIQRQLEKIKENVMKKFKDAYAKGDQDMQRDAEEMHDIFTIIAATVTGVGERLDEEKVIRKYGNAEK